MSISWVAGITGMIIAPGPTETFLQRLYFRGQQWQGYSMERKKSRHFHVTIFTYSSIHLLTFLPA
jgi:hypothetical protein